MQNTLSHHTEEFPDELDPGTLLLHGQYQIESYLIRGGFGITYLARDSLDRRVVIKECFPSSICCRFDGLIHAKSGNQQDQFSAVLRHFLREAHRLARLTHPNIVGVHQVFEENSTAYMALDYVDGMDLLSVVEDHPHRLNPDMIRSMLMKSLGAISYIHDKGILHRDISPDNFLLDSADNLTLIDFGAAREQASKDSRALSSLLAVKDGYSPQEFYLRDVTQHACSDLYALGATFYHLITGKAPPISQQRLAAVAADATDPFVPLVPDSSYYEPDFLSAINKALELFPEDRIQSAQDWVEEIDPERRRQAAVARANKDSSIRVKISKLVAETNQNLRTPAKPLPKKTQRADSSRLAAMPVNKVRVKQNQPVSKPVDIFGEPIEDVEAWLWAQDDIASREHKSRALKMTLRSKPAPRPVSEPIPMQGSRPQSSPSPVAGPETDKPASARLRPRLLKSFIERFSSGGLSPLKKP